MPGQDRLDHRHVGGDRHAVVEEAGNVEPAIPVIDVFLVQGPADALRDAALDLAFDIGGVDRAANILRGDNAQDRDLAGLGVDLDIAERGRKTAALTAAVAAIGSLASALFAASSFGDSGAKSQHAPCRLGRFDPPRRVQSAVFDRNRCGADHTLCSTRSTEFVPYCLIARSRSGSKICSVAERAVAIAASKTELSPVASSNFEPTWQ